MNATTIIVNGIAVAAIIAALIKDRKKAAAGIKGILTSTGIGAILHIPALIGFPVASSLISAGASTSAAAGVIATAVVLLIIPDKSTTFLKKLSVSYSNWPVSSPR